MVSLLQTFFKNKNFDGHVVAARKLLPLGYSSFLRPHGYSLALRTIFLVAMV